MSFASRLLFLLILISCCFFFPPSSSTSFSKWCETKNKCGKLLSKALVVVRSFSCFDIRFLGVAFCVLLCGFISCFPSFLLPPFWGLTETLRHSEKLSHSFSIHKFVLILLFWRSVEENPLRERREVENFFHFVLFESRAQEKFCFLAKRSISP